MSDPDAQRARAELIERLNTLWRIAGPEPASPSLGHRLLRAIRQGAARLLRPQETFNSAVVQYLNASAPTIEMALDRAERFHESLGARERRLEEVTSALRRQQQEIQAALSVVQHASRTLARSAAAGTGAAAPAAGAAPEAAADPVDVSSSVYVGFEDQFRGPAEEIRARLAEYVPLFSGASDVLDVGCGRGEFLDLLRERGVQARGLDINQAMVDVCREKGLDATRADALSYLRALPDGSLGGLFAAQVVEHLAPAYLTQLLETAFDKLRPGATVVLETINPACWFAFFESYIRDITHVRPLHPDTLRFLLVASGFQQVDIQYRSPYPEHEKLQAVTAPPALKTFGETLNGNFEKLNSLLFTYLDYAAVARRP